MHYNSETHAVRKQRRGQKCFADPKTPFFRRSVSALSDSAKKKHSRSLTSLRFRSASSFSYRPGIEERSFFETMTVVSVRFLFLTDRTVLPNAGAERQSGIAASLPTLTNRR
jgi:hypothetical protein